MRVLHVNSGNLYGGIETYLVTLAALGSRHAKMESEFALCFSGRLSDELLACGARIHWLGEVQSRYPWKVLRVRKMLGDLLRRERYDVVICHSAWSQAIFGPVVHRAAVKVPLILYLHGPAGNRHWLDRWASRVPPDYVICNSFHTQSSVSAMYPEAKSTMIYLPVPAPKVFTVQDRTAVRSELQTPADSVVIAQVSRMEPWKGHQALLQSLARMADLPGWRCWIVGGAQRPQEERYLESLKRLVTAGGIANRVLFLGQRSDVARLLHAADIFVQANATPEPFGIAFIEALYAGLPVVTSDFGGGREIINESCGVLVPPGDQETLQKELRNMVASPQRRLLLGKAGPSRARELVEPETQLTRFSTLLAEIVQQGTISGLGGDTVTIATEGTS